VIDLLGREVALLVDERKPAGEFSATLHAQEHGLTSGVYFCRLRAGDHVAINRMVLLK
jgi:hypothetical protein